MKKVKPDTIFNILFWVVMVFVLYLIIRMAVGHSPLEIEIILVLAGLWVSNSLQWEHVYYKLGRIEGILGMGRDRRTEEGFFR